MGSSIINIPMSENIIDFACGCCVRSEGKRTAFISGGKRQFLFMKKKLAAVKGKAFIPPSFFTSADFIENIVFEHTELTKIPDIEAAYMIYEIVEKEAAELLKGKRGFAEFFQWALEIVAFIEQLDLEKVSEDKLKNIKANADIGYDVPQNINALLKNIFKIREIFHRELESSLKTTQGYSFLKASEIDFTGGGFNFDEIVLMAPFYMHKTETEIFKKIYDAGLLTVIVQGSVCEYDTLKKLYADFNEPLPEEIKEKELAPDLNVYSAFDDQSQAALLKNLIRQIPREEYGKTVVIVPQTKLIQPVAAEISSVTEEYNISAGYPVSKTAVFTLLEAIAAAQLSRKGGHYYVKDLMKVFANPLVKNMRFFGDASLSRIIAHKIGLFFGRDRTSSLSGKIFVSFDEIIGEKSLLKEISESSAGAFGYINEEKLKKVLSGIFETLFGRWEKPVTLAGFAGELRLFTEKLYETSILSSYPLNSEAAEILLDLSRQMLYGKVSGVGFAQADIFNIFSGLAGARKIALSGSPLRGLQILGLLESRNLSFENVFIIGMTDCAIPSVKKESPLVPKEIMFALGIEMAKKEYEIQKYHFNRLIRSAKKIGLIYPENEKEERSRFIERLVWDRQRKEKNIAALQTKTLVFPVFHVKKSGRKKFKKTGRIMRYLVKMKYSYSKIDTYLRCGLEFYFKYVLGLEEAFKIGSEASGGEMGSFIHKFLQTVFCEGMKSGELKREGFKRHFFNELDFLFENSPELKFREDSFLIKKVLWHRMEKLLAFESAREYDFIYCCEKKYETTLDTQKGVFGVECVIDRADKTAQGYAILDYKTGRVMTPLISRNFEKAASAGYGRNNIKKAVKSLQLPLYRYIFERCGNSPVVNCGVYDIKKSEIFDFFANSSDSGEAFGICIEMIKSILCEIAENPYFEFDKNDAENCENCKYFYICRQYPVERNRIII